jgi:hypothetical protein
LPFLQVSLFPEYKKEKKDPAWSGHTRRALFFFFPLQQHLPGLLNSLKKIALIFLNFCKNIQFSFN